MGKSGSGKLSRRQPADGEVSRLKRDQGSQYPEEDPSGKPNEELYVILYNEEIWTIYRGIWKHLFNQTIKRVIPYLLPHIYYPMIDH